MAKTLEQLLSLSSTIANETRAGANTALRVGGLFSDIIYYLRDLDYADKDDIPSLEGYATEQWVLGKGYATTTDLDARIDALVNGAPAAYDTLKEIADVLAGNVNSISDILTALGNKADKATTLSGYGITDAYTITQIDSIVNVLSGNISTLQGYFTDGVANSALKLSDNGSYTAWGQTFFTNGKPKSVSGALTDVTDIVSSGTITTNKIVIGNGTIEWDEANKGFKVTGLYSTTYLSAKGANSSGGSSSGDGLITSLYRYADLGKTFSDTNNDTFNAYTINKINADLGSRISVLEGKATNVSFTQSLTSGTQIGSISIDGASKNIYAPTIPTDDINKGVTAYGWGNHASVGYLLKSGGTMTGNLTMGSSDNNEWIPIDFNRGGYKGFIGVGAKQLELGSLDGYIRISPTDLTYLTNNSVKTIWHSGNFTPSDYLPLSGGTISGIIYFTKSSCYTQYYSFGKYYEMYNATGKIGIALHDNGSIKAHYDGTAYDIIHSGNIGSQSVDNASKLGGKSATEYYQTYGSLPTNKDLATLQAGAYWVYENLGLSSQAKSTYSSLCVLGNAYYSAQLNVVHDASRAWLRGVYDSNSVSDWHELAFTDSNVASATKLQTARTIWGQSFDGTGNVSGSLIGADFIRSTETATDGYFIGLSKHGASPYEGLLLYTYGYTPMTFYTNGSERMRITSDGYVLICTTTNSGYKLDVNGTTHLQAYNGDNTYVHIGPIAFGMKIDARGNGNTYFQSQRFDNTTTYYNIIMQENGGNVGIGTPSPQYKLDINGDIAFSSASAKVGIEYGGGNTNLYNYIQFNADSIKYYSGGWTSGNHAAHQFITSNQETRMVIMNDGNVGIGTTSPEYKLDVNGGIRATSAITTSSAITTTFRGGGISGLYPDSWISGANANRLWLYNEYELALYGSTIELMSSVNVSGTLHAITGIWSDGYVSAKGQNTSSDMRLKNVLNNVVLGVKDIANAPSVRFAWKNGGGVDIGSSAQYWQVLLPDAVKERDGMLEMQYANIALLSAIAIAKRSENHEERIKRLEKENIELKQRIVILEGGSYA